MSRPSEEILTPEVARDLFPTLEERRRGFENVMWQVPSLSITAQAFLFSAAFGSGVPDYARISMLVVGLTAVVAAMHLLAKHRYLESLHGQVVAICQREQGWPTTYRKELHSLLAAAHSEETGAARWYRTWVKHIVVDVPAFNVWMLTLGAFAVADLYLLSRAIF